MAEAVYWTMKDGEKVLVEDMTLQNTLKMIIRQKERLENEECFDEIWAYGGPEFWK